MAYRLPLRAEIEAILFHDNTVIVMGSGTITPVNKAPFAGQTVRRRLPTSGCDEMANGG
jgi:hypothetical protein